MRFRGNIGRSRIAKDSRRIPIYGDPIAGDGEDAGKWFRCWNCGFVCNAERDALGDSQSRHGGAYADYAQSPDGVQREAMLGGIASIHMATKMGSTAIRNAIMVSSSASTGCPMCHSLNWRGDY